MLPAMSGTDIGRIEDRALQTVKRVWGYDSFRPLQREAIEAGVARHDSLVVLPTGGGKSLCYQVPPLLAERTDIKAVTNPLILSSHNEVQGHRLAPDNSTNPSHLTSTIQVIDL